MVRIEQCSINMFEYIIIVIVTIATQLTVLRVILQKLSEKSFKIFGSPDYLKLCSSMTLFAEAVPEEDVFRKVLDKYYGGKKDERTLDILKRL